MARQVEEEIKCEKDENQWRIRRCERGNWKERTPELLQGYSSESVWNLDETACFWRALLERGFSKQGSQCKGGKKTKQRMTICLIANADGEKEAAIVIWKSENLRCFKRI